MSDKNIVVTDQAPAPASVFSQAVKKGGLLQVSGQGPMDPVAAQYVGEGDVRTQTLQSLENVRAVLEAGGSSVEDVIMFRIYLTKRELFGAMNEAYGQFINKHVPSGKLPGRTTVFVDLPHEAMLVEIDALAVVG